MNFLQSLSRPLRLAGVVLLGVALVAVVIGTITALGGPSTPNTASPASSSAPGPGRGSTVPGPASAPAATSSSSGAPAVTSAASSSAQAGAPVGSEPSGGTSADQTEAKWVQVRVYNNSTITGLAARAASDLRADGWNVAEAANYPYGIIPTTTAYFTPGTDEETAAKALATAYGMKAEPRFAGIQNASPGVIVIVTNDYQGQRAKGF